MLLPAGSFRTNKNLARRCHRLFLHLWDFAHYPKTHSGGRVFAPNCGAPSPFKLRLKRQMGCMALIIIISARFWRLGALDAREKRLMCWSRVGEKACRTEFMRLPSICWQPPAVPRHVDCADTRRNRSNARPKKKLPISATAKNSGHTTSRPAPR